MGNLRKDYVSERFVIVNEYESKKSKNKKNPYKSGNESMTNPSVLSLVQKDEMLQRLQDDETDFVKNWSVRVFPATEPSVTVDADNSYTEHPLYSEPAYGYHYIISASPDEKETLSTISIEQWGYVLSVVQDDCDGCILKKVLHMLQSMLIMEKKQEAKLIIHTYI